MNGSQFPGLQGSCLGTPEHCNPDRCAATSTALSAADTHSSAIAAVPGVSLRNRGERRPLRPSSQPSGLLLICPKNGGLLLSNVGFRFPKCLNMGIPTSRNLEPGSSYSCPRKLHLERWINKTGRTSIDSRESVPRRWRAYNLIGTRIWESGERGRFYQSRGQKRRTLDTYLYDNGSGIGTRVRDACPRLSGRRHACRLYLDAGVWRGHVPIPAPEIFRFFTHTPCEIWPCTRAKPYRIRTEEKTDSFLFDDVLITMPCPVD